MKNKLLILLLIIAAALFLFRIFQYKDDYLSKFDPGYWNDRYLNSQWVVVNSKESIGDDGLYAYAGWEYIHGRDPSLLNAEVPPFGKYLIGLSEIIFTNQNIFALLCGLFVLISFYFLNKIIFKNTLLALIPAAAFSAEPLFYTQLRAPFLDLLYLGLLIMIFIFVLKGRFLTANIFLGLMAATKASSSTFILITIAIVAYLFFTKNHTQVKKFLLLLPVSIFVFLLTYIRYFFLGHNLWDFLALQKWIITFYESGAKGNPLAVWQILLSGQWPNWFGPVQTVNEWNILWPLALLGVIFYFYKVVLKRHIYYLINRHSREGGNLEIKNNFSTQIHKSYNYKALLMGIWILIYLIFLSIVPVWPRYLLTALPFMYTITLWVFIKPKP